MLYRANRDQVFLTAVHVNVTHILGYGQAARLFEKVCNDFVAHPAFRGCDKLSTKSVWDMFKKLKADFKQKEATNTAASGIAEQYPETDELMQEICNQIDEYNLEKLTAAEEESLKNEELLEAGREIRKCALERVRKKRKIASNESSVDDSGSPSSRCKAKDNDLLIEDEFKNALEQADRRHAETVELEKKKFELSENIFNLEKEKLLIKQNDHECRERELALQERKLVLDEKRFDHQRRREEERDRQDRKEREENTKLMLALVKNLTRADSDVYNTLHEDILVNCHYLSLAYSLIKNTGLMREVYY